MWWWLLPPWAAPDEPGHYLVARLLAESKRGTPAMEAQGPIEASVIASLASHDWWGYNHRSQPANLPERFAGDPVLAASGDQTGEPRLFYVIPAWWLRQRGAGLTSDLAADLRRLRLGTLALHLLATLAALVFSRIVWPDRPDRALALGLLVGLLPMAGFVGVSFNNNTLAVFWGVLAFGLLAVAWLKRRAWLWVAAGVCTAVAPLLVDPGLLYLWLVALVMLAARVLRRWPRSWPLFLVAVLALAAPFAPNPGWAAGWRQPAPGGSTRANGGLALAPLEGAPVEIAQTIGGKETLAVRSAWLQLEADLSSSTGSTVDLTLADDVHALHLRCQPGSRCSGRFVPAAVATTLRVTAATRDGPAALAIHLWDEGGRDLLFNGDGRLPELVGRPLFEFLERALPVPAGYFSRAVSPAAWNLPSQFRYALFAAFTWASFWGYFGWLSRPLPAPVYLLLAAATLAALGGLIGLLPEVGRRWRRGRSTSEDQVLLLSLLAVFCILMQTWAPMVGQAWQPQGRYFLAALLPVAILLMLGWGAYVPTRWQRYASATLAAALVLLNLASWWVILP